MSRASRVLPLAMGGIASVVWLVVFPILPIRVSQASQCRSNLKSLGIALEIYATDNQGRYPRSLEQLTPNYLKALPECPLTGRVTYRVSLGRKAPLNTHGVEEYYLVECPGAVHESWSGQGEHPAWNSFGGLVDLSP